MFGNCFAHAFTGAAVLYAAVTLGIAADAMGFALGSDPPAPMDLEEGQEPDRSSDPMDRQITEPSAEPRGAEELQRAAVPAAPRAAKPSQEENLGKEPDTAAAPRNQEAAEPRPEDRGKRESEIGESTSRPAPKRPAQTDFSSEFQEKRERLAEAFRGSQHEYVTIRPLWLDVLISVAVAGLIGTAIYFVLRATGLLQSFQKRQRRERKRTRLTRRKTTRWQQAMIEQFLRRGKPAGSRIRHKR